MGYYMTQRNSVFHISAEQQDAALAAIQALAGTETIHDSSGQHFSWVADDFAQRTTLKDILDDWRWEPIYDEATGDIVDMTFAGEKLGDDFVILRAIAPFVDAGSFLEMEGEDRTIWRWVFDGQTVTEEYTQIVWKP